MSRWGIPASKNAQYVVQPYYVPENVSRFSVPPGVFTHILRSGPSMASFKTVPGSTAGAGSKSIAEHVFTAGVPAAASETVHIDQYDSHHARSALQVPAEFVIEKFEYLP